MREKEGGGDQEGSHVSHVLAARETVVLGAAFRSHFARETVTVC